MNKPETAFIIEELLDGRYAITKEDWEEAQIAWAESVKEAHRLGREEAKEEAIKICKNIYSPAVNETAELCACIIQEKLK